MGWFGKFITSSIGQKILMSLTGLFLITFLVVHLAGNLQLLSNDGGQAFNIYAKFMTTFPPIKVVSYGLYTFILVHAFVGWRLWLSNRSARGSEGYAVQKVRAVGTNAKAASNMGWLGTIIFVFLLVHLYQFWLQMKMGTLPYQTYDGEQYQDLYLPVKEAFSSLPYVIFYVICMGVVGLHLWHGFQSSFQTLGLNHKKYTPLIRFLGKAYSVAMAVGFAIIPVVMYLKNAA